MTLEDIVELMLCAYSFEDFKDRLRRYRREKELEQEAQDKFIEQWEEDQP